MERSDNRADLLTLLQGGDRRSIGRANEALARLEAEPMLLARLVDGMTARDAVVRMRAADVVEKYTAAHPAALQYYKDQLLAVAGSAVQQEVRWHLAQMLPRLDLSPEEADYVCGILNRFLTDPSRIVQTFAMQGLADLALKDTCLIQRVLPIIEEKTREGTPAMQSRGKKLLARLARAGQGH